MKKRLFAMMAAALLLTMSACSGTPTQSQNEPMISKKKQQNGACTDG